MKMFTNQYANLLRDSLDVYTKQQEALSKNVSNIDTVDYQRANTNFLAELDTANDSGMVAKEERHMTRMDYNARGPSWSEKDEQVNMTREMAEMSGNQIKYEFAVRSIRRMYDGVGRAISGRVK
jgi:flagellar basal-body rod protein FlgB